MSLQNRLLEVKGVANSLNTRDLCYELKEIGEEGEEIYKRALRAKK